MVLDNYSTYLVTNTTISPQTMTFTNQGGSASQRCLKVFVAADFKQIDIVSAMYIVMYFVWSFNYESSQLLYTILHDICH